MTRILIVEDESIVALDMQTRLQRLGYEVPSVASTGERALELAAEIRPDLVLMDIMLQGEMDGVEAADQIRERFSVPIIFLTAYSDEKTLQRAKIAGPFGYILKPFKERELHSTIEIVLRRHQVEVELEQARDELDLRVQERTAELAQLNDDLIGQVQERERAEADLQVRYEQSQVLYRLSDALARADAIETILQEALDTLEALTYDRASVRLVEEGELVFRAWRELSKTFRGGAPTDAAWPADAQKPEPVLIADIATARRGLRQVAVTEGLGSAAFFPLLYEGNVYGEIGVYREWPHPFDEEEVQLLQTIATHVEFALGRTVASEEKADLEGQLRESQKMEALGQLAGGIAHDFNNMLTIITGYSDLVINVIGEDDPLYQDLRAINDAGERAALLTGQLLAFSRRQVLHYQPLFLNKVVRKMEELLQRVIGEDIQLSTELEQVLGFVQADSGQIEQVIMNLVVNARDAMPRGGRLIIATGNIELDEAYCRRHVNVTPGPHILLRVTDTGAGMSEEVIGRIFEPFFSTKSHQKGSGLGLSTVYGIVNQSGGHIDVASKPGHGTSCSIYLPQVEAPASAEADMAETEDVQDGDENILLVEDEDIVRDLAGRILRDHGYNVIEARRGDEAMNLPNCMPERSTCCLRMWSCRR